MLENQIQMTADQQALAETFAPLKENIEIPVTQASRLRALLAQAHSMLDFVGASSESASKDIKEAKELQALIQQELNLPEEQATRPRAKPPTVNDVLDALQVFNTPASNDNPWTVDDAIVVKFLPSFIHQVGLAWYAPTQPQLTVKVVSYPESNGKRNWTAVLKRTEKWDGLVGNGNAITLAQGEYWNRVAYTAECARFLIGERTSEPFILDYGNDITTPDAWSGEVSLHQPTSTKSL